MKSILTVISPATSYDLTVLETVKSELGISSGDTSKDTELTRWIHEASGSIARFCRRVFAEEVVLETFRDWDWNSSTLFLQRTPISFITSITVDGVVVDSDLYEFDANDQIGGFVYPLDSEGRRESFPLSWNNWYGWSYESVMAIQYTGGYALLGDLPYEVEQACIELVRIRWNGSRSSGGSTSNVSSIEIPGVWKKSFDTSSKESNSIIPDSVKDLLSSFKKPLRYV